MNLCQTCRKMLYRTDPCKGVGVECGRTDGGSKKAHGGAGGYSVAKPEQSGGLDSGFESHPMRSSAPVVESLPGLSPKPKYKDRHKPGYQAQKQREYRARKNGK